MKNPYEPIESEVLDVITESPTIKTLVLRPRRDIKFQTGQFVEVTVPGLGEAPFTPSSDPAKSDQMDVTIMNVGKVTSACHKMKKGDTVGVRGPYGKGYPLNEFKGKEVLIVGGGVGLAPLRSLLFALFNTIDDYERVSLKYGAKGPSDIIYKDQISEWGSRNKVDIDITVDNGDNDWKGKVGLVTTLIKKIDVDLQNSVAIVCGPPIMMKFSTFALLDGGFQPNNLYLSMEKNMSCGVGKCGHCRLGNYYACKDGPVFTYDKIKDAPAIWD